MGPDALDNFWFAVGVSALSSDMRMLRMLLQFTENDNPFLRDGFVQGAFGHINSAVRQGVQGENPNEESLLYMLTHPKLASYAPSDVVRFANNACMKDMTRIVAFMQQKHNFSFEDIDVFEYSQIFSNAPNMTRMVLNHAGASLRMRSRKLTGCILMALPQYEHRRNDVLDELYNRWEVTEDFIRTACVELFKERWTFMHDNAIMEVLFDHPKMQPHIDRTLRILTGFKNARVDTVYSVARFMNSERIAMVLPHFHGALSLDLFILRHFQHITLDMAVDIPRDHARLLVDVDSMLYRTVQRLLKSF